VKSQEPIVEKAEYEDWRVRMYIEDQHSQGDLNLDRSNLTKLPDNLTINGDLNLNCCSSLQSLPNGLEVKGFLNLYGCGKIKQLPVDIKVGEGMDLRGCGIEQLPTNLTINGDLFINARHMKLSNNLTVKGSFNIYGANHAKPFPRGLKIIDQLYLNDGWKIHITDLPCDLKAGNILAQNFTNGDAQEYLTYCKLKTKLPELEDIL